MAASMATKNFVILSAEFVFAVITRSVSDRLRPDAILVLSLRHNQLNTTRLTISVKLLLCSQGAPVCAKLRLGTRFPTCYPGHRNSVHVHVREVVASPPKGPEFAQFDPGNYVIDPKIIKSI